MNERIKELAGQAKFMAEEDINKQISYNTELKAFAEKFAQLIVRECVLQIADVRIEHDFDPQVDEVLVQALTSIKKHFGVAE